MAQDGRAQHGVFLLLRRLRLPLIVLLCVYAVSIVGFTLVPGVTPQGDPWQMSFFHAVYFVSFLGTTIGLGELPYPFTDAQRLWAVCSIYTTVLSWLYAIGALFATLQDPMFRRMVHEYRAAAGVRRMTEPFYLICGYDDSGSFVARELAESGVRVVVVDKDMTRVDAVEVDNLRVPVPALQADATHPRALLMAGLSNGHCAGVIALTGEDGVNVDIALAARLLNPDGEIICAARWHQRQPDMAAVGATHIINPFDTFAERLVSAIQAPSLHVIYETLTSQSATPMASPRVLPTGRWIVCGHGPYGRTVRRHLERIGIEVTIVDEHLDEPDTEGAVMASPTRAETWRTAGIESVGGVVICGSDDTENLTACLVVRQLNPEVFIAVRQNERRNVPMFRAAPVDIAALSGHVVAAEVLRIIRAPQLSYFLRLARQQDEAWSHGLLMQMREHIGGVTAESWSISIDVNESPAVVAALRSGRQVLIGDLMRAPDNRNLRLRSVPLLLRRDQAKVLLPDDQQALLEGDRLLLCGRAIAARRLAWTVRDDVVLAYVLDGTQSTRKVPWPRLEPLIKRR